MRYSIVVLFQTKKTNMSWTTTTTIISTILSLVALGLLIWLVIVPTPLKIVVDAICPSVKYAPNSNALVNANYTFYSNHGSKHDKLVIVFLGGSLLFSNILTIYGITNLLNEKFGNSYDIVTFSYPTRFKYTVRDALLSINKSLADFINYDTIHAVGISVGALLAGAFYQKEKFKVNSDAMQVPQIGIQFKTFSALSGVFETKFNASILTALFKFYIMRNTPSLLKYTCYGMNIPKLIICAKSDFLLAQTVKFIRHEPCEYHIYESPLSLLPHAFSQFINLPEARDSIDRIVTFINKNDKLDD